MKNKKIRAAIVIIFWLFIWQIVSMVIDQELLFASPIIVAKTLFQLLFQTEFWLSVFCSFLKISFGFLIGFVTGIIVGILAHNYVLVQDILAPFVSLMKSIPVASFIIVTLVWVDSSDLSIFISFFIVFPMIYLTTVDGLNQVDFELLEMAKVFRVTSMKKIRYIYVAGVMPFLISGCRIALGMCWKAGIAAEVIGLPTMSIGEQLYMSKIYLDTASLFSWTIVIIGVSVIFERVFVMILKGMQRRLEV